MKIMKATGIVRRIDHLGRLVIPKEIRKKLQLKEGSAVEFYTEDNKVIVTKFDPLSETQQSLRALCQLLSNRLDCKVMFYNDGQIIESSLIEEESKKITTTFLQQVETYVISSFNSAQIFQQDPLEYTGKIFPIVEDANFYGSFIVIPKDRELTEQDVELIQYTCEIVESQLRV